MKKRIFILIYLVGSFSLNLCLAQNKKKTKQEYITVIKDFYKKMFSSEPTTVRECMIFFESGWVAEMEEYLFLEDCEKNKKIKNCNDLFQQLYYGTKYPASLYFAKIKEQKIELMYGLKESQIMYLIDSCSVLIDDGAPDRVILELPFHNSKKVYFYLNKYFDEPSTISIYLSNGASIDNKIIPKEVNDFMQIVGTINDPDGYVNIRKGTDSKTPIIGKIKSEEQFYYTPNSYSDWWQVVKKDSTSVKGYVYYDRIKPYYNTQ